MEIPVDLKYNNSTSENLFQTTELLADYFASVYSNFNNLHTPQLTNTDHPDLPFQISPEDIITEISHIKCSYNPGPDGIPSIFIKNCSDSLVIPLLILFNSSLASNIYPSKWKYSYITPIFKNKGDRNSAENYRPISIISSFAKLLDSIFTKNSILIYHPSFHPSSMVLLSLCQLQLI